MCGGGGGGGSVSRDGDSEIVSCGRQNWQGQGRIGVRFGHRGIWL